MKNGGLILETIKKMFFNLIELYKYLMDKFKNIEIISL